MNTNCIPADTPGTFRLVGIGTLPDDDDVGPVDGEEPFDDEDEDEDDAEAEEDEDEEVDDQADREMTGEIGSEGGGPDVTRVPGPGGRYPRG